MELLSFRDTASLDVGAVLRYREGRQSGKEVKGIVAVAMMSEVVK